VTDELKQAITLIRSGNKAKAGQLLTGILKADPQNELAWLWMSQVVKTRQQQQQCLEKVLAINPRNKAAQKALVQIKQSSQKVPNKAPEFSPATDPFTFKSRDTFQTEPKYAEPTPPPVRKPKVPPRRHPPQNAAERYKVFIIGGVIMLNLALIIAVSAFAMQSQQYQQEFGPIVDVCRGEWVRAAARYSNNSSIHPAIGVEKGANGWELDNGLIPRQARAQSMPETELVLCLGKVEDIFIESCPYTDLDNPRGPVIGRIERYYYKQEARLIEASTGRVVSQQTFTGKSARLCKEIERLPSDGSTVTLKGTSIPRDQIQRWVESELIEE